MAREPLPTTLQHLDASSLRNFLRRAIREQNRNDALSLCAEYKRRGICLVLSDYWQIRKIEKEL